MKMKIDINCDMGEGFGRYTIGSDAAIMPSITSANLACGFHAGDPSVMLESIRLAKKYHVAIGAHPGWPDLQGFGRREMSFAPREVEALVLYQISALAGMAKTEGVDLRHVKPHGALYNQAVNDVPLAEAIGRAVQGFSRELLLVGLAGSRSVKIWKDMGITVANEGFADRYYAPDGTLVSRHESKAIILLPDEVARHAVQLVQDGIEIEGVRTRIDTICLHGDHPRAAENAAAVRRALESASIEIAAL